MKKYSNNRTVKYDNKKKRFGRQVRMIYFYLQWVELHIYGMIKNFVSKF